MSIETKNIGTVVFFNAPKGWGFIQPLNTVDKESQLFVHFTDIEGEGFRTLEENERVSFDAEETPKGGKAVNVQRI